MRVDPEHFWAKTVIAPNGCREWHAAKDGSGYGVYHIQQRAIGAHRVACELEHGPAPEDRPWALHHCDNPSCVEGEHLYWGSPVDNARDRSTRGRDAKGAQGYCINGHEFTEENTYYKRGGRGRSCRACHRIRAVKYYHAKKVAA